MALLTGKTLLEAPRASSCWHMVGQKWGPDWRFYRETSDTTSTTGVGPTRMADGLNNADVDALIDAVAAGEVETSASGPQIFTRMRHGSQQLMITPYDFTRPERVGPEQIRALTQLHETFARALGAGLSGLLRAGVQVSVQGVSQTTYASFIRTLENPTCTMVVQPRGLEGQICIALTSDSAFPILERLLGGSATASTVHNRPMTEIESRLMAVVCKRMLTSLSQAWHVVAPLDFQLDSIESNPEMAQLVPPNEVVVSISFDLSLFGQKGRMYLGLPFIVIEPLIETLSMKRWECRQPMESTQDGAIGSALAQAEVELIGVLASTTLTLSELATLEVGDVLTTRTPVTSPATLWVEDRAKFATQVGEHNGRRALKILRGFSSESKAENNIESP